ncbi:MAG: type II toxin-antitoxin system Phd/YefM family antitoxin [Limnobacter sp.]|jgi:antitoxin (DNA-binding transcriptional repressor) of toxin-antitoxin stability system
MAIQVSKSQFKAKALEFFRQVESTGESLIITDHGVPTLEIKPFKHREADPFDVLRDTVLRYDSPTDPVGEDEWDAAQ